MTGHRDRTWGEETPAIVEQNPPLSEIVEGDETPFADAWHLFVMSKWFPITMWFLLGYIGLHGACLLLDMPPQQMWEGLL